MPTMDIATLGLEVDARQIREGDRALDDFERTGRRADQTTGKLDATLTRMAAAMKAVIAAIGLQELIKMADTYASIEGRLKMVTANSRELAIAQERLFAIAQRTRTGLEGTVDLYTKLTRTTQELNVTDGQRLRVTETINKAMSVSGAKTDQVSSALMQLGQAFGANTLRGEELNAILESTPRLAQAIAEGMGRTTGELRAMSQQGKLTGEAVFASLLTQSEKLDAEFEKMPVTVGQVTTMLQNSLLQAVGIFDKANGVSAGFASVLGTVAANMDKVIAAAMGLGATMLTRYLITFVAETYRAIAATAAQVTAQRTLAAANLATAATNVAATAAAVTTTTARLAEVRAATMAATGNIQLALATNALIPAQARATAAAAAHSAALVAQAGAARAAAGAAGMGGAAMAALGGPVGLITAALGLGVAAWMAWGNSSEEAAKQAADAMEESTDDILASLRKQNAAIEEKLRLLNLVPDVAKSDLPADKKRAAILAQMHAVTKEANLSDLARTEILRALGGQYNALSVEIDRLGGNTEKLNAALNGSKMEEWLKKNSTYTTKTEQLAAAIADAKNELGKAFTPEVEARIRKHFAEKGDNEIAKKFAEAKKNADEYIAALDLERRSIGATEQQLAMLEAGKAAMAAATDEQRLAIMENAWALGIEKEAYKETQLAKETAKAANDAYVAATKTEVDAAWSAVNAMQAQVETYGMGAEAINRLTLSKLNAKRADLEKDNADPGEIARVTALIDATERLQALQGQKTALDELFNVDKAQSFGDALRDAFGEAGNALAQLTNGLQNYADKEVGAQKDIAKAKMKFSGDDKKISQEIDKINDRLAKDRLAGIASMAGAAKGFFKENSKGYKVMEAAEKGFRAFEMAMTLESMYLKVSAATTAAAATATGAGVAAAAVTAGQAVETSAVVAGEAARNVAKTPGVFMAFMSAMGPWGLAAAAVAIGLVLGGAGGGGGGAATFDLKGHQEKQGTGTVLGDDSAKSNSIGNSIEILEQNSRLELGFQSAMLMSLRNIESSVGGAAKGIFQTSGLTGGSAFGTVNTSSSNFFGSDTSTTIADTGVKFSGSLGQLRQGQGSGSQYEMVNKYDDGGWFHGDRNWTETNSKELSSDMKKQFALIFDSMGDMIVSAGVQLGSDADVLTNTINQMAIDFTVSTRGLKGQELVDALSAGLSVAFDQVAANVFPTISQFQKVGEGMGETLVRVAAGTEVAKNALDKMGLTMGTLADLTYKQGDVAAELVRQAIMGRETVQAGQLVTSTTAVERFVPGTNTGRPRGGQYGEWEPEEFDPGHMVTEFVTKTVLVGEKLTGIGEIMKTLSGTADELAETYMSLRAVQTSLKSVGLETVDVTRDLIKGAGDLTTLQSSLDDYFEGYFTEAEQTAAKTEVMRAKFAALGQVMPESLAGLRAMIEAIPQTTEAGRILTGQIIALTGEFADLHDAVKSVSAADLVEAYNDAGAAIRDQLRSIGDMVQGFADRVVETAKGIKSARDAISTGYFGAQDEVAAAQKKVDDLAAAAAKSMNEFASSLDTFIGSLGKGGANSREMLEGLRAQFNTTANLAQGGDKKAQGGLVGVAEKLLSAERRRSSTGIEYAIAESRIKGQLESVANASRVPGAAGSENEDPMTKALADLAAAQKKLGEYSALAVATGASTDRSSIITANSVTALLAAYNSATAADAKAREDYATALALTSNLALTTTHSLSGLLDGLVTLSEAQADFITARNDLAKYIIETEKNSKNLALFAENLVKNMGLTGVEAEKLAALLSEPGTAAQTLATLMGTGAITVEASAKALAESIGLSGQQAIDFAKKLGGTQGQLDPVVAALKATGGEALKLAELLGPTVLGAAARTLATDLGLTGTALQTFMAMLNAAYAAPGAGSPGVELSQTQVAVADIYETVLKRAPDLEGMKFWVDAITSGVLKLNDAATAIAISAAQANATASSPRAGVPGWTVEGALADKSAGTDWLRKMGVPGFASGGMFGGGLRMVGENGPEIEATGSARIWSNAQTRAMLAGGGSSENSDKEVSEALSAAIVSLKKEVEALRLAASKNATAAEKTERVMSRVTRGENFIYTKAEA